MPTFTQTLGDINMLLNIFMGFLVCYLELRLYFRGIEIKLFYALAGLAWGVFYTVVLIEPRVGAEVTRITCLRPLITLTLAVMASGAIIRYKTLPQ